MKKLGLVFLVSVGVWGIQAQALTKSERVLLIVTELKRDVPQKYRAIYEFSEKHAVEEAVRQVGHLYREIHTLRDREATVDRVAQTLSGLAARTEIEAIDVSLHLHGLPGSVHFSDGAQGVAEVATRLAADRRLAGKLRALYSTACFGVTHGADWLRAGFRAANGAKKVNANTLHDYPAFLKAWGDGQTFAEATELGNDPYWRNVFDSLARHFGFGDADSEKEVFGAGTIRIDDKP